MFNDHQVMGQNSQQALAILGGVVTGPQRRAQPSLVPRDHTLDLPAISIDTLVESPFHLAAISCLGPAASGVARVQRNNCAADAQLLSAQPMIALTIVARIGQQSGQAYVPNRLAHRRSELAMVVAGAANHVGGRDQMALRVTDDRQLGPPASAKTPVSAAFHEVGADVVRLQAGGVNGALGPGGDQAALGCPPKDDAQQPLKSPFFTSRCSA